MKNLIESLQSISNQALSIVLDNATKMMVNLKYNDESVEVVNAILKEMAKRGLTVSHN